MKWVILEFSLFLSLAYSLPDRWTICRKDSPDYNQCIQDATNSAIHDLVSGNEQYGLPPIDPLAFLDYSITSLSGPVSLSASFKNINVTGFKNSQIEDMMTDWKTMNFSLKTDKVSTVCDCVLNGRLLTFPLSGSGKIGGTFVKPTFLFYMKLSEKKIDGKTYYHVDDCAFHLKDVESVKIQAGSLFGSNNDFSDKVNKAINDNFEFLVNEIRAPVQEAIGRNAKYYVNLVFAKFPKVEITPP